jgi:inosine-uridine nucleoside N-ribohydrolase
MTKKIIIDTDPGIDDAQALCYAIAHPELELLALTCIYGNVSVDLATQNALRLCDLTGVGIPVARGADAPLQISPHPVADFVHGKNGFGNVPLKQSARLPDSRSAAALIVDLVREHPGQISLVPIGPLTNIALALQLAPDIVDLVDEVIIMGGAVDVAGNVSPFAEANIWNDPHAANQVLTAAWPVTIHGLNVTHQVIFTPDYLDKLAQQSPQCGGFLRDASRFYSDFYRERNGFHGCCPHDLLAICYAANPHWYDTKTTNFRVVTEGEQVGRTESVDGESTDKRYATNVKVEALLEDYLTVTGSLH